VIEARYDDLTPGGKSFRLVDPIGVVEARRPDEVVGCLEAAAAAASRGLWAGGFVAYEAAPGLDPALVVRSRERGDPLEDLPLAWFAMFERRETTSLEEPTDPGPGLPAWVPSATPEQHAAAVERIRELIAEGQTYQVNYTMRMRARVVGDERGLYRDVSLAQRGAYSAYLNLGRYRVLSTSPELFFRIDGATVTTRPMKGTAPRGRSAEEDRRSAARLEASEKDRAENAMIVDLLRNDLGRIAVPGSVRVSEMFTPERYETVWQLTSTILATLPHGVGVVDVFRALFPSGSVTGAPKIRTMEIIAGIEDSPRGAYCGAVGFLAPPGAGTPAAEFNVAIRTIVLDTRTGLAEYGTGGGITYGSRASAEYEEALTKARVLAVRRSSFELLETIRHEPDEGFRHLELHLQRMEGSADYFGFRFDRGLVQEALEKAVAGWQDGPARVRVTLARDGSVEASMSPAPQDSSKPLQLAIDDRPVDPTDAMLFHKTTRRERYDRARARHPGADDVLLVNTRGEVTESTIANVAVKLGQAWWTPPVDCGLLPGVGRAAMLAEGSLAERRISVEELRGAEGIALVSSVRGFRPAALA
jgi:para-aminobenzoate synthetase/4-amino-4-deoxychorismate lyase